MKISPLVKFLTLTAAIASALSPAEALDGVIGIHDPSTVVLCDGKYYVWGTGGSGLVSDDGWTWRAGTRLSRGGLAPDVVHIGDRYFVYVAANIGGQPRADVNLISSKSLDPNSPDYKWEDGGVVASSDGVEDCNAIDPGAFLDPTDHKLYLTCGSYFGYIRLVQLDAQTGKRVDPHDTPVNLAVNCEASDMIYHDGWYYLFATHGSCCQGANSGYNIRVGRSRSVTGPFIDQDDVQMLEGGGKLFCGSAGRVVGPGHFGLIDLGNGVQKFSCHYEADLDRGGASVLDIRPLLWKDGWPEPGDNFKDGTYEIQSVRTGTSLELAVQGVPVGGGGRGRRGVGRGGDGAGPAAAASGAASRASASSSARDEAASAGGVMPTNSATTLDAFGRGGRGLFAGQGGGIPAQGVAQVSSNWPAGSVDPRLANYLCQAQQKWAITAVINVGGYPGSPYFKITIAGTDRTLAATDDAELVVLPAFTGGPDQLWRIDQLTDGTYRIMPKGGPKAVGAWSLSAVGASFATLADYNPDTDRQRWLFKAP